MTNETQFDSPNYQHINEKRRIHLDWLLKNALVDLPHNRVADLGCGAGYFSDYLHKSGCRVEAFDGREENITEAHQRYPQIPFKFWDIEDAANRPASLYDLVLCFGLLYHLENPFLAIRNLFAVTGNVAVIESVTSSHELPVAVLYDEPTQGEAQALNFIALIPSESAFVKMLYAAGFSHVYKPVSLPDHPEFHPDAPKKRTVLVAARSNLNSRDLIRQSNPKSTCIRLDKQE